ncbi:MAG: hypothetical protein ACQETB_00150 [Halobacteriota archaeon]
MSNQGYFDGRGDELADTTVEAGPTTVRKVPERREDGLVVRYTLESAADVPIDLRLTDELPVSGRSEIGFHPDNAPQTWAADGDTVVIEHTLDPNETARLLFGIVFEGDSVDGVASSDPPAIEVVDRLDPDHEAIATDGSTDRSADGGLFQRAKGTLFSGRSGDSDGDAAESGEDSPESIEEAHESDNDSNAPFDDSNAPIEGVDETLHLPDPTDPTAAGGRSDARDASGAGGDAIDHADEADALAFEMGGATVARDDPKSDAIVDPDRDAEAPTDDSDRTGESDEGGEPRAAESVVSALVSELQSGDVSDAELEALRDAVAREQSRSEQIRMRHLQSRMDDFAAHVDLLEAFVDEYGTISEYAAETGSQMETLRADLEAIDDAVSAVQSTQSSTDSQVDAIESQLESIEATYEADYEAIESELESAESQLVSIESELESVVERHDSDVASIADRQDAIETDVERVGDTVRTESERVDALVDEFQSLCGTIADAFDTTDLSTGTDLES